MSQAIPYSRFRVGAFITLTQEGVDDVYDCSNNIDHSCDNEDECYCEDLILDRDTIQESKYKVTAVTDQYVTIKIPDLNATREMTYSECVVPIKIKETGYESRHKGG